MEFCAQVAPKLHERKTRDWDNPANLGRVVDWKFSEIEWNLEPRDAVLRRKMNSTLVRSEEPPYLRELVARHISTVSTQRKD